jgi:hypothetical protein
MTRRTKEEEKEELAASPVKGRVGGRDIAVIPINHTANGMEGVSKTVG